MHEGRESSEVIVARTYPIIQVLHSSMTTLTMNGKTDWNGCWWRKETIRSWRSIPLEADVTFPPLLLIDFSMTHLWLHRRCSWLAHLILGQMTQFVCHPLSLYVRLREKSKSLTPQFLIKTGGQVSAILDFKLRVKSNNTNCRLEVNCQNLGKTGPYIHEDRVIATKQTMRLWGCCWKLVERLSHGVQPW